MKILSAKYFPLFIVFYEITIYLSMDAYVPAMHQIGVDFNVGDHLVQYTVSSWVIGSLLALLFVGPFSERFGRRPVLFCGGVIYTASCLACAVATGIHGLLLARFFQGMGMPTMVVAGYAVVNEYYESQEAIKIIALMSAIKLLAPAFGPLLGGLLLIVLTWQWIFIILAFLSFTALIFLFFSMPETLSKQSVKPLKLKIALRQYQSIMAEFSFVTCSLVTVLPIVGLIVWLVSGTFIVHHFGFNSVQFGLMQVCVFSCYMLGNTYVKRYSSVENNHIIVRVGMGLALFGSLFNLICSLLYPSNLLLFVGLLMLVQLGCGLSMPILSRKALEQSKALMGIRVTVFTFFRTAAAALGTVCVAWFYNDKIISISSIIFAFTLFSVCLGLLFCRYLFKRV
jgi:multidrug resistance protein